MSYWHEWHWWIVPVAGAFGYLNHKFVNWLVLPDGRWRWQRKRSES